MNKALFKWKPMSKKQRMILEWWCPNSPYKDFDGIIADGAIRSGKTVSMGFSFVIWAMESFDGMDFAICGKTISSLRRNVVNTLKKQLASRGYTVTDKRADNLMIVERGDVLNTFYFFGGKDESSQDLIQGMTLAGILFDEVALMPESFVNQATARCSVDGSKYWFNCNPSNPQHWFYLNWVTMCREKRLVYLHFTMEDNLTLSERIRQRYANQYVGVFFERYIKGLWVAVEGIIYRGFSAEKHLSDTIPETEGDYYISSDYGMYNDNVFLLWRRIKGTERWFCFWEESFSNRDAQQEKGVPELVEALKKRLGDIKPKRIIIDPSASAMIIELKKNGFKCLKADNDVLDGIVDVQTMLSEDRLLFDATECKGVVKEFGLYSWDSKASDRGEDKPLKTHDHRMDAIRYFVRTMKLVKRKTENPYTSYLAD